jgi:pyranose oxidase
VTSQSMSQQPWPENLDPISQPATPPIPYAINGANPDQKDWENMPAGASSFNVGGMGAHWTCCTPRPTAIERIPFIPEREWDELMGEAEKLLNTNQHSFDGSLRGRVIQGALAEVFDPELPEGRKVGMLPLACERLNDSWVEWTGCDTILGPLADPTSPFDGFELWPEHICRILHQENGKVTEAEVENLRSGKKWRISATTFIVAANAFYTPQLLWKSNIRPHALGRFLNDQPLFFCQIVLKKELLAKIRKLWENEPGRSLKKGPPDGDPVPIPMDDPIPNVWIPFSEQHPYHCQIHRDAFPYSIIPGNLGIDHRAIVDLRWFTRKEIREEDRISFSEHNLDQYSMPQITFHYTLSDRDGKVGHAAIQDMSRAAATLGGFLPGSEPQALSRGSSLHYQGTFRMGDREDEKQCVCDPYSRVWSQENLYLGGNGIIPTATACNPTLTSVALAIRASRKILRDWPEDQEDRPLKKAYVE